MNHFKLKAEACILFIAGLIVLAYLQLGATPVEGEPDIAACPIKTNLDRVVGDSPKSGANACRCRCRLMLTEPGEGLQANQESQESQESPEAAQGDLSTPAISPLPVSPVPPLNVIEVPVEVIVKPEPTLSCNGNRCWRDVAFELSELNIAARAGHHCAHLCHSLRKLKGSVRASFHVYNTLADVDRLIEGLEHVCRSLRRSP